MNAAASHIEGFADLGFGHVVPVGQKHDGALLHTQRRDRSKQVEVGCWISVPRWYHGT